VTDILDFNCLKDPQNEKTQKPLETPRTVDLWDAAELGETADILRLVQLGRTNGIGAWGRFILLKRYKLPF
jgi:hypothetical protein